MGFMKISGITGIKHHLVCSWGSVQGRYYYQALMAWYLAEQSDRSFVD